LAVKVWDEKTTQTNTRKRGNDVKFISVGKCSECGTEFLQPDGVTQITCYCQSETIVKLKRAIEFCKKDEPLYAKVKAYAKKFGVTKEKMLETLLEIGLQKRIKSICEKVKNFE
jgi:DNA-directed RNA polymerase subunit RPC12/RpoP